MDFVIKKLKKLRPADREMTTLLFLLRCVQLGLCMTLSMQEAFDSFYNVFLKME